MTLLNQEIIFDCIFICLISFCLTTIHTDLVIAQDVPINLLKSENKISIFGCSSYDTTVHCDPLNHKIESYSINATSSFVYLPLSHGTDEEYGAPIPSMIFAPDGRLFFTEKDTGHVRIFKDGNILPTPFVKIQEVYTNYEQGMLGITIDPDFEQNHFVYLYHTYNDTGTIYNKLVRFTDVENLGTNMTVILDNIPAGTSGMHSGGALGFGPDEKLYIVIGDRYEPKTAQDMSELTGKILRINKDGTIPGDNPFPGSPIFTLGHRNMFGIAFDNDGQGIVSENGVDHYDEINIIEKGGNYGWPTLQPPNMPPEISNSSIKPIRSYWKVIAPTQAIFYDGDKFPELKNKFLFGSYIPPVTSGDWSSHIYSMKFDNDGTVFEEIISANHQGPVLSIAQSPSGEIYYGGWHISKLETIDINKKNQNLFLIEVFGNVNVKNVQIFPEEKKLVFDFQRLDVTSNTIQIKIPRYILDEIFLISDGNNELQFVVNQETDDFNIFEISLAKSEGSSIIFLGNTVIPEFPNSPVSIFVIIFIVLFMVTVIQKKQMRIISNFNTL